MMQIVTIQFKGKQGSGKTTLLNLCFKSLVLSGYKVSHSKPHELIVTTSITHRIEAPKRN